MRTPVRFDRLSHVSPRDILACLSRSSTGISDTFPPLTRLSALGVGSITEPRNAIRGSQFVRLRRFEGYGAIAIAC